MWFIDWKHLLLLLVSNMNKAQVKYGKFSEALHRAETLICTATH